MSEKRRSDPPPEIPAQENVVPEGPQSDRAKALQLLALSFIALFLELVVIRWVPSVVRFVAYYANLMLISSFLGLGLGALLSSRGWRLFRWFPLVLVIDVAVLLLCRSIVMPGTASEVRFYLVQFPLISYAMLILVFALNAALFVPLGERIGWLFQELPTLKAYSVDLIGSLLGTVSFGLFSLRFFSPAAGFAVVMVVYLLFHGWRRRAWAVAAFAPAMVCVVMAGQRGAVWSPYYYITVDQDTPGSPPATSPPPNVRTMRDPPMYSVRVNQDFYQQHGTIDLRRYTPGTPQAQYIANMMDNAYMLPYQLRPKPQSVLVVGAGGGIDVEAALLSGASHVDAVEIDKKLISISRRFSASGVYDDPRVSVHINDARAFFRQARGTYDVIAFGFLDSQALFSYSNNIRLDGYIYTVESIREAFSLLKPDGLLSISFVAPQPWLASKLRRMVAEATGREPTVYAGGIQFIFCATKAPLKGPPQQLGRFVRTEFDDVPVEVPRDDWPYLYLSERAIPEDYLLVIGTLIGLSAACVMFFRGGGVGAGDGHFFFLGVGFLLLETKSISDCALYFGATWVVTMLVISGILLMVLAANLLAMRRVLRPLWLYVPLVTIVLALYLVPRDRVLSWPLTARVLWTVFAVPLPVFFAGLIFSTTFRGAPNAGALLGANLIGGTVGGFCEYLGLATGLRALSLLVIIAYGASALCYAIAARRPPLGAEATLGARKPRRAARRSVR